MNNTTNDALKDSLVSVKMEIGALKKKYFELKMSLLQGNEKVDTSMFGKIKRDIARLKCKFGV